MDVPLGPKCPFMPERANNAELGYQFGQETHLQLPQKEIIGFRESRLLGLIAASLV